MTPPREESSIASKCRAGGSEEGENLRGCSPESGCALGSHLHWMFTPRCQPATSAWPKVWLSSLAGSRETARSSRSGGRTHSMTLVILAQLGCDLVRFLFALFRTPAALAAENIALRSSAEVCVRCRHQRRRLPDARKVTLVVLDRLFGIREQLVLIAPRTVRRWGKKISAAGFWLRARRRGRPPLPNETIALIRQIARVDQVGFSRKIAGTGATQLGIRSPEARSGSTCRLVIHGGASGPGWSPRRGAPLSAIMPMPCWPWTSRSSAQCSAESSMCR